MRVTDFSTEHQQVHFTPTQTPMVESIKHTGERPPFRTDKPSG